MMHPERAQDASVEYPEYYLKPFHAYSEGNLCWQAAFEAEPATLAMALRVWPQEGLTWDAAQARLRRSFLDCISQHISQHQLTPPSRIVDVGCSVGISTRAIHDRFDAADIVGLDLSPYMLAVAAVRDEQQGVRETGTRRYVHGAGEATGMADASVQLVTLSFLIHELPQAATVGASPRPCAADTPCLCVCLCVLVCQANPLGRLAEHLAAACCAAVQRC